MTKKHGFICNKRMKPPVGLGANETFPVTFQPQKLHCQDTCRSQPNSYCNQFRLLSKLAGLGENIERDQASNTLAVFSHSVPAVSFYFSVRAAFLLSCT